SLTYVCSMAGGPRASGVGGVGRKRSSESREFKRGREAEPVAGRAVQHVVESQCERFFCNVRPFPITGGRSSARRVHGTPRARDGGATCLAGSEIAGQSCPCPHSHSIPKRGASSSPPLRSPSRSPQVAHGRRATRVSARGLRALTRIRANRASTRAT